MARFMGGDLLEGNVIFDMVRETGDHGTFNSWSRREWFYDCALAPSIPMARQPRDPSGLCLMPALIRTQHNFFIGPAGWNMDHDDGSSNFHDFSNVVYQGGYKYRDGQNRNMTANLMVAATPKFQVDGFDTDVFSGNNQVGTGTVCGPATIGGLSGNKYWFLTEPDGKLVVVPPPLPVVGGGPGKCDPGPIGNLSAAGLYELTMRTVAHASTPLHALLDAGGEAAAALE
jgi:hypothetical protein